MHKGVWAPKMSEMGAQTLTQLQSDLIIGRKKFDLYKYTSICNRTTIEMIGRNLCVQGLISSSYPHPEDIYTAHCTNIAQILQEIYNCVTQAQTCCLFQQCSLLHIVSAIDWGHMCFDSPHTSTLNHSRHTYCNTNVSVSDFCKLIFQILKCVLSVCTRTLETPPQTSFIEAYDIRSLELFQGVIGQLNWSKIDCETRQSLYGSYCSS